MNEKPFYIDVKKNIDEAKTKLITDKFRYHFNKNIKENPNRLLISNKYSQSNPFSTANYLTQNKYQMLYSQYQYNNSYHHKSVNQEINYYSSIYESEDDFTFGYINPNPIGKLKKKSLINRIKEKWKKYKSSWNFV